LVESRLREGKNRQVLRMTASVCFPTLRLILASIGDITLDCLALGEVRQINVPAVWRR